MIVATLAIRVMPEKREQATRVIFSMLGPMRAERGCISCDLYRSASDTASLTLIERWESYEDLTRHIGSDHYRNILAWLEMSTEPPEIRFETVSDSQGLDMIEKVRATNSCRR